MARPPLFKSLIQSRCPACRQGPIFETFFKMYPTCATCGTVFEREHGYFLVSMFFGYALNGFLFIPIALYGYFTDQIVPVAIGIGIALVLLILPTFHYARVLWMYVDQMLDPRRDSQIHEP